MIEHFDLEGFAALVWKYANLQGIITPISWEKIISKSFGGIHIPGDKYMADGKKDNNGINIKHSKSPLIRENLIRSNMLDFAVLYLMRSPIKLVKV